MFGHHFVYLEGTDSEWAFLYVTDVSEVCTFKSTGDAFLFWKNHRRDILKGDIYKGQEVFHSNDMKKYCRK